MSINRNIKVFLMLFFCTSFQAQNSNLCEVDKFIQLKSVKPQENSGNTWLNKQFDPIYVRTVVHVIHSYPDQDIPDMEVIEIIDNLNQIFSAEGIDTSFINPVHQNFVTNTNIRFCLANNDPDGNLTSGITHTHTDIEYFASSNFLDSIADESVKFDSLGGVSAWNVDEYFNIWIAPMVDAASSSNYGLPKSTYYPLGTNFELGNIVPGAVLDLTGGIDLIDSEFNILAHEVGHAMGLYHIWGWPGSCEFDDFIQDTPRCQFSAGTCGGNENSCIDEFEDQLDNSSNVMGYNCMLMFTNDQSLAMRNNLLNDSSLLTNAGVCNQYTSVPDPVEDSFEVKIYPNPNLGTFNILLPEIYQSNLHVEIFDSFGKRVFNNTYELRSTEGNELILDLSQGIYSAFIHSSKFSVNKLIVVQE